MESTLVVVYSYTGTSRRVAQQLCACEGWPLGEVREVRPRGERGGWWRCVLDSILRRRPAIQYVGPDPARFATVVLVAPVWAGHVAGPMRSFVAGQRGLGHVAILMTAGSSRAGGAFRELERLLGHPPAWHALLDARTIAQEAGCAAALARFGQAVRIAGLAGGVETAMARQLRVLRARMPAPPAHVRDGPSTWREPHGTGL